MRLIDVYEKNGDLTPDGTLCARCYDTWGDIQTDIVVEELSELIYALDIYRTFKRSKVGKDIENLAEEFVDVTLVLGQLQYIYDVKSGNIFTTHIETKRADDGIPIWNHDCLKCASTVIKSIVKMKRNPHETNLINLATAFVKLERSMIWLDVEELDQEDAKRFRKFRYEFEITKRQRLRERMTRHNNNYTW